MRAYLLLMVLMMLISQSLSGQIKSENSFVEVVSSKWTKSRQKIENPDNQATVPAQSALAPVNKNFERNRRINDQVGTADPSAETIEARSAALEKNVQESRSPKSTIVEGFLYQTKIRNISEKTIEVLFWEYQFIELANPANMTSHQFLCGINIKRNKEKELSLFSTSGPSSVVSVDSLDKSGNLFGEKILINRVEYTDGTIWQRKDWSYSAIKSSIVHALATPWGMEMCRKL